jgi:hypothetical protein
MSTSVKILAARFAELFLRVDTELEWQLSRIGIGVTIRFIDVPRACYCDMLVQRKKDCGLQSVPMDVFCGVPSIPPKVQGNLSVTGKKRAYLPQRGPTCRRPHLLGPVPVTSTAVKQSVVVAVRETTGGVLVLFHCAIVNSFLPPVVVMHMGDQKWAAD